MRVADSRKDGSAEPCRRLNRWDEAEGRWCWILGGVSNGLSPRAPLMTALVPALTLLRCFSRDSKRKIQHKVLICTEYEYLIVLKICTLATQNFKC